MANNRTKFALGSFLLLAIVAIILSQTFGLIDLNPVIDYIEKSGTMGLVVFVLLYILFDTLAIPGSFLSLSAGYLFGPLIGFFVVIIGAGLGSLSAFSVSRYLFHDYFHKRFATSKMMAWTRINNQKRLTTLIFTLRLIPIFPYNALNYGLALTKIKTLNYVLATVFGIIPGVFVYVYLGSSLTDIFSMKFLVAILLFVGFLILASFIKKRITIKPEGEIDIPLDGSEVIVNKKE